MSASRFLSRQMLVLLLLSLAWRAVAIDITVLPNEQLQRRYQALTHEFRCMQCQNNSIADSPVGLASDLRREVAELLVAGKSDDEIRAYMVQRYGNVILFTPPLAASTAWVWMFPVFAVFAGAIIGVVIVRRRSKLVDTDDSVVEPEEVAPMILAFVLIAGSLATAAALLLLRPLLRRREDTRPAAAIASIAVLLTVLLGGAGLYASFSNYKWNEASVGADTPAAMTARLAKRLAGKGGSVEEWLTLGRSYGALEQYPLALRAYQRADQLANGQNAEALMGMAEILVQQNVEELRGRAGQLFERALEIDPTSRRALFYGAFAALGRGEPALARMRFNELLAQEQDPTVRALLERGIASANEQESQVVGPTTPAPAPDAARIAVHVSVAPELAARVPPGATLFVAARDPKSPGPPFAVKRLAARFPVDVELTGADAMLESRRISAGQQLEVVARVALGGTPTATSGDPFGQVGYHVGKDGRLNIVIDRLAP